MKISYNWLGQYIQLPENKEELSSILTNVGLEVEEVEQYRSVKAPNFNGLVVGLVKTVLPHPNAEKLQCTTVDVGLGIDLNIVCGAKNVAVGQKVIVATVGATIYPISGEPLTIKSAKIRGEQSEGMLCAEDEIGLGTSHDGIMVLDENILIGTLISDLFPIYEDTTFELNITPNRVDATCHLGVGLDVSAVTGNSLKTPEIVHFENDSTKKSIKIDITVPEDCNRYAGVIIRNIEVKPSPIWLQNHLRSIGLNPINNIVDVTNYVMFEMGQPMHAFDLDKIDGHTIVIKLANPGEKFITLDGKEKVLSGSEMMICNANHSMAIAGVYGGINSGVTNQTKDIFIESAYFNPESIRKTSRKHQLFTDSAFRFERGVDSQNTVIALKRAIKLLLEVAGGQLEEFIYDENPIPFVAKPIPFSLDFLNRLAGDRIPEEKVFSILNALNIEIESRNGSDLILIVPSNKPDVTRKEDIAEEILRVYGFNNIQTDSSIKTIIQNDEIGHKDAFRNKIRNLLANNGLSETVHLTFIPEEETLTDASELIKVLNPLGLETEVVRDNLLTSGLKSVAFNLNRRQSLVHLFELGFTYHKTNENPYAQKEKLGIWLAGNQESTNWITKDTPVDFYFAKGITDLILNGKLDSLKADKINLDATYLSGQFFLNGETEICRIAEINPQLLSKFDIKNSVYYLEFDFEELWKLTNQPISFKAINKFPFVERDLALLVDKNMNFESISKIIQEISGQLLTSLYLFDVYSGKNLPEGKKSYGIRLRLESSEKTMTEKEIENVMSLIVSNLVQNLSVELRS